MTAIKTLLNAINTESDPYRISIEPSNIQNVKIKNGTLELDKPKFTLRVYFKVEDANITFTNFKFTESEQTYIIYNKYNSQINHLNVGYYFGVFDNDKLILVNEFGVSKEELLKLDILGELISNLPTDNEIVKTINGQLPDVDGNINIAQSIGTVKIDNATIRSDADNKLYVDTSQLPNATIDTKGLVKVDNNTIKVTNGVISTIEKPQRSWKFGTVLPNSNLVHGDIFMNTDTKVIYEYNSNNSSWSHKVNLTNEQGEVLTPNHIVDNLLSTDNSKVLSADMGKILSDKIEKDVSDSKYSTDIELESIRQNIVDNNSNIVEQFNSHELSIASNSKLGHVKVDGRTIIANEQGEISAIRQPKVTSGNITPTVDVISGDMHLDNNSKKFYEYNGTMNQWGEIADFNGSTGDFIPKTDIIDNLTSSNTNKPLSAKQGRELSGLITSHNGTRASKSAFGHVKIGDGLLVSNGTVSMPEKEYLHCMVKTADSDLTARSDIDLGDKVKGNINMNLNTLFYLSAGKKYLVTFDINIKFRDAEENNYCALALVDRAANVERSNSLIKVPVNRNTTESGNGILQAIVYPTTGGWYSIRCSGKTGSVYYEKYSGSLTIIEI